jgi:Leucine-rich repeat (LRR) protein
MLVALLRLLTHTIPTIHTISMALQVQALCILMRRSSPWMTRGPSSSGRKTHLVSSSPIILPGIHFVQSLDLSGNQISDKGMESLCQGLPTLTSLQSLDVSGNKIKNIAVLDKVYKNIVAYSHVRGHSDR